MMSWWDGTVFSRRWVWEVWHVLVVWSLAFYHSLEWKSQSFLFQAMQICIFGVYCLLGDFKFYYSTRWLQYVITSNIVHSWDGSVCKVKVLKAKFIFCRDCFVFWRSWYGECASHSRLIICALHAVCKSLSNIQKASLNLMCSPSNPRTNCQLICTFLTINVIPIRSVLVFSVAIQQL